jgi:hypothetical protein
MSFRIGSAVRVPGEDLPQRITRLDDYDGQPSAWYQAMVGDKPEKGPVPVSILMTGVALRGRSLD